MCTNLIYLYIMPILSNLRQNTFFTLFLFQGSPVDGGDYYERLHVQDPYSRVQPVYSQGPVYTHGTVRVSVNDCTGPTDRQTDKQTPQGCGGSHRVLLKLRNKPDLFINIMRLMHVIHKVLVKPQNKKYIKHR